MLDQAIAIGTATEADIEAVGHHLGDFYKKAPPVSCSATQILESMWSEHRINRRVLSDGRFELDHALAKRVLAAAARQLDKAHHLLAGRIANGLFVEGHGDLRPEHVCLIIPPVIIDCLEFNFHMRVVDPLNEIAFLDLECELLGAAWIGKVILSCVQREINLQPAPELWLLYRTHRALLRARLALAHLYEPDPRSPEKWEPRAQTYLELAERGLSKTLTFDMGPAC
jgi:aminoglycoside phosphotransferase family enzyme